MKAIPMKGRLTGKKVRGYLWAGPGEAWRKKENYFQVEDDEIISAALFCSSGSFWVRCITEVQTNRELVSFENHLSVYPNSVSLFHSRSPFHCA